jgi:ethanolamine ammonia-lyase large subunit
MVAAVSKIMRNQDLMLVRAKCRVVTRFRNTIGLPGRSRAAAAQPPDRRPARSPPACSTACCYGAATR